MLTSARLTLKHHRFEVVATTFAALALAAACVWLNSQLVAISVPGGCFERWLDTGGEPGRDCAVAVSTFMGILYSNMYWLDPGMVFLPIAAGTLVGVPIVARELETRTAQTAWALSPSRSIWLTRQIWPILLVVGTAVTVAAIASSMLNVTRANSFPPPLFNLGFYGPLVVARALVAFGVGLSAGALIGRSLPALIVSAVVCVALVIVASTAARDIWVRAQQGDLFEQADPRPHLMLEQLFRTPGGELIPEEDAFALVPETVEDPYLWLFEAGYVSVGRGITAETAARWEGVEVAGTFLLGIVLVGAAYPLVNRRRPT